MSLNKLSIQNRLVQENIQKMFCFYFKYDITLIYGDPRGLTNRQHMRLFIIRYSD